MECLAWWLRDNCLDTGDTNVFLVLFLQARSGRIYDAVLTVAKAIEQILAQNKSLTQPPVTNGLCRPNKSEPWVDGEMLLDEMKKVSDILFWLLLLIKRF